MTVDQIALHNTDRKPDRNGIDNPALVLGSRELLPPSEKCSPPSYSSEKSYNAKDTTLTGVYVVPSNSEKPAKLDDYEPYSNRQVAHPTTFFETLIHLLKASLGTGILAMPNAFHNAGWGVGIIGTVIIGVLCTYCIHSLISAVYELCRRKKVPSMTYPESMVAALEEGPECTRKLAKYASATGNAFIMTYQLGTCCIYFVFVASNVKAVADYHIYEMDVRVYMCILLIPFMLINSVKNLKLLAPFSTLANGVTVVSFCLIGYYLLTDIPSLSERAVVAPFKRMPLFFGTVLFAMEAIGVVMPLENEMNKPEKFASKCGVLNMAMLPIICLYSMVGFLGFLKYGTATQGSITLNLPTDHILAQSVKLMLAFSIYITHGLALYVSIDIVWNQHYRDRITKNALVWEYVIRIFLVFVTFFFAVLIPNLELFISLIGAICLSTMGLSFPAIIQLLTFWNHYSGARFLIFFLKNLTIILIAVLGFLIGTSVSVNEILHTFFL